MGIVVLGSGLFAAEVADLIAQGAGEPVEGFVEALDRTRCATELLGLPVAWVEEAESLAKAHRAVCAIGSTRRKASVERAVASGFEFANVIHPSATVSATAELGVGCIIGAATVVGAWSRIGSHVILNRGALVGHHTEIGDFVTVSPGANIAGSVTLDAQVFVGMGALVLNRLTIGGGAIVGAGAVVTRDVAAGTQVQGVPARVVEVDVGPR